MGMSPGVVCDLEDDGLQVDETVSNLLSNLEAAWISMNAEIPVLTC